MPERKVFRDYQESDVRDVFARVYLSGWQDLVNYLNRQALASEPITPGEDAHLIADAKQAAKDNVPFAHNPEQAYRVLKSHRNPELVRQEEQKWLTKTEQPNKSEHRAKRRSA